MLQSGRLSAKFDFEQSAFSPTEIDDSYLLYYRYPRDQSKETNGIPANTTNVKTPDQLDASKYTLPCQKYLRDGNECATAQRVVYPIQAKIKSSGVDDGFKGEAAKCGSSIIGLANMFVSGKVVRGFQIEESPEEQKADGSVDVTPPPQLTARRGSKSLPASPSGSPRHSPKCGRRMNKYFTGPFVESEKHQGSWILSNLLGAREKISQSCDMIAEEESEDPMSSSEKKKNDRKKRSLLVPKPSELREMNFWSPTSM
ncbi:hypothetical protein WA026_009013 [Henosepilachna vigintioctopunctata]|uniref:Uncharacterized protein n=1 Tax=Henosepilachna vigintioctopunctata TaxID=420089 RepID=A0AAW1UUH4_9CUCU